MADKDTTFSSSIAEIYDTYVVPLIFEAYAADLAARVASGPAHRVLEVAAGTGVVTRHLVPLLGAQVHYTATDLNVPMLNRAQERQDDPRITWQQADAMALPFEPGSFDVVVCQFGVMFFPDKVAAYRETCRVLTPGGRFLFNAWDRLEYNVVAHRVTEALGKLFPADPPRFMARVPHAYHDVAVIEADLAAAGFTDIVVETRDDISRAPSARDAALAICTGTPTRNEIEARPGADLEAATDAAAQALAAEFGSGAIAAPMRAHIASAVRPSSTA